MDFPKYSVKLQILIGLVFGVLNFFFSVLCTQILHIPLFMDMVFIFAASFFGLPCGIIASVIQSLLSTIIYWDYSFRFLYGICCITGTLLTRWLVCRNESSNLISIFLLIFVSTVVISIEGSLIYSFFFTEDSNYVEDTTILFITYNLVAQNIGLQISAFFARLPVNLIDKTIAVLGGLGIYVGLRKIRGTLGNI